MGFEARVLRDPKSGQRAGASLLHQLLPRWTVLPPGIRLSRGRLHRYDGRFGHGLPQGYQVSLPQIWALGNDPKARCPLRYGSERDQREDIHVSLVLVRNTDYNINPCPAMAIDHVLFAWKVSNTFDDTQKP